MDNERIRPTKSGLFMIELLIAVGVFAFCAAVCVSLFVYSEAMSRDSADLTRAVTEAKNAVECWKASGGDLERTALLYGGHVENGVLELRFDRDWNRSDADAEGFCLRLTRERDDGAACGTVRVSEAGTDEPLLDWQIAALGAREAAS